MRNTEKIKLEAFRLYCLGLTSKEIGKLLDVPFRTVQGYMTGEGWKEKRQADREREEMRIYKRLSKLLKQP
jgi:hypothetical protein